jgi:predicted permease
MLILIECCLAVVLLAGAGLLLRSLEHVRGVDPGFDPSGVMAMRVEFPPEALVTTASAEQARAAVYEQALAQLVARIATVPGVRSVGFIDDMFIGGQPNHSITIPGRETASLASGQLNDASVTPSFFDVMRVPLRRGRMLTHADALTKTRALYFGGNTEWSLTEKEKRAIHEPVVVNEAFVKRFFPNDDPIGKTFCIDPTNKTYWYEIVGVVGDMHRQGLESQAIPEYFGALIPSPTARADLMVRVDGDPLGMNGTIRQLVTSMLPGALIPTVSTADSQLGEFAAQRSLQTWLLTLFAALALGLAAVGIYGVVHYAVAERTREIGVRIALGAPRGDILSMVLGRGLRLACIGGAVGLAAGYLTGLSFRAVLAGVEPTDVAALGGAITVALAMTLAGSLWPALRAARTDPMTATRAE